MVTLWTLRTVRLYYGQMIFLIVQEEMAVKDGVSTINMLEYDLN